MVEEDTQGPDATEEGPNVSDAELREIHACIDYPVGQDLPDYAAMVTAKKWRRGTTLRVRFLDGDKAARDKVAEHAQEWCEHANIFFKFGDDEAAEIRISFLRRGTWSAIGVDALNVEGDRPTMNFGWLKPDSPDAVYRRAVLHEFGHALGLIHEHQNPAGGIPWNKPAVYRYYAGPPNNWTAEQVDKNILRTYQADLTQFTRMDKSSIMVYPIPRELTTGGFEVGWNTQLSDDDKVFIAEMYRK